MDMTMKTTKELREEATQLMAEQQKLLIKMQKNSKKFKSDMIAPMILMTVALIGLACGPFIFN